MAGKYEVRYEIRFNRLPKMVRRFPEAVADLQATIAQMLHTIARPPVGETGNLSTNVEVGPDYVHWRAPYAGFVNFGTRYMAARPFVDEAVKQVRPKFLSGLEAIARNGGL
jgi:HK97 gp10 family phage protein